MSRLSYKNRRVVSFQEVIEFLEAARRLPGFAEFSPLDYQTMEFKCNKLPPLDHVKALRIRSVSVNGWLPAKVSSLPQLRSVFLSCAGDLGAGGDMSVTCGFQELNSKQSRSDHDYVMVLIRAGKAHLAYSCGRNGATADLDYRKNLFAELTVEARLPMRIVDQKDGFTLEHTQLTTKGSVFATPLGFFLCHVPDQSPEQLFDKLEVLLKNHASNKWFRMQWCADSTASLSDKPLPPEQVLKFYQLVASKHNPADKHEVGMIFFLDNVESVEEMRRFIGAEGSLEIELCSFPLPNKNSARVEIETHADGYQLNFSVNDPDCIPEIEKRFKLRLVED